MARQCKHCKLRRYPDIRVRIPKEMRTRERHVHNNISYSCIFLVQSIQICDVRAGLRRSLSMSSSPIPPGRFH